MKTPILFIQGAGEGTHADWDSKLVDSLRRELGDDYAVDYPPMPDEGEPDFARWCATINEALDRMDEGVVLVGHSFGGTAIAASLARTPPARRSAGVFLLAAPFFGEGGWDDDDIAIADLGARLPQGLPVRLYQGDQDEDVPPEHLDLYAKAIPQAVARKLPGRDHQLHNDLSEVAADIRALIEGA